MVVGEERGFKSLHPLICAFICNLHGSTTASQAVWTHILQDKLLSPNSRVRPDKFLSPNCVVFICLAKLELWLMVTCLPCDVIHIYLIINSISAKIDFFFHVSSCACSNIQRNLQKVSVHFYLLPRPCRATPKVFCRHKVAA